MIKYTAHFLKKLEGLMEELNYQVRYEKGNFQSGYCWVEHRNIAVINKFYDTTGRINVLLDILSSVTVPEDGVSEKSAKFLAELRQHSFTDQNSETPSNS